MDRSELLRRMATTLKHEVAAHVEDEYARTQAHMAAVVLDKLSRELAGAAADAVARGRELEALAADLGEALASGPGHATLDRAVTALAGGDDAALADLVAALYAARKDLGERAFGSLLGRVRTTLRARLDRQLAWSK